MEEEEVEEEETKNRWELEEGVPHVLCGRQSRRRLEGERGGVSGRERKAGGELPGPDPEACCYTSGIGVATL